MIDTHFHLMRPPGQDAAEALKKLDGLEQYRRQMDRHGITGGILVQPSAYRFDNSLMLAALERYPELFKGVAAVPGNVRVRELEDLRRRGVVGVRLNMIDNPDQLELPNPEFFSNLRKVDLFLQMHVNGELLAQAVQIANDTDLVLIIDHLGKPDPQLGIDQSGFRQMIEGAIEGSVYIKLSAPFRISGENDGFEVAGKFARAALDLAPLDRFIVGTDWPFIRLSHQPSMKSVIQWLRKLLPQETNWKKVTLDNARKLTGLKG